MFLLRSIKALDGRYIRGISLSLRHDIFLNEDDNSMYFVYDSHDFFELCECLPCYPS